MKKLIAFALSAAMALSLTACGRAAAQPENAQISNPFLTYDTLEAAAEAAGFDLTAPEALEGYDTREIRCSEDGLLEVSYRNGDGETVSIRKAMGAEDVSGDYNRYAEERVETVNGRDVVLKGADGMVFTAVWTDEDSTYAISSSMGMEKDTVTALVETVSGSADAAPLIGGNPATWGPALEENVQIPSPFTDCDTLEEAAGVTGFGLAVPQAIEGYDRRTIQVISGTTIQVIDRNSEDDTVVIRKAPGSDDISGDYSVYAQNSTISVGDREVSVSGDQDMVYLATWTDGGYTYAMSASAGLSVSAVADLVAAIR